MTWLLLIASCAIGAIARADVRVAGVFADHMVLQRRVPLPLWGWAEAGEHIEVKLASSAASATTDQDGKWHVELPPLEAISDGVDLTIQGKTTVAIHDVLVGEVWLASGQSNMQYAVKNALNAAAALRDANRPMLRLCTVGSKASLTPLDDRGVRWSPSTSDSAKGFSAVAYFFASELQQKLSVPVGIIGAYVAGTPAQSWTDLAELQSSPQLAHYVDALNRSQKAATTNPSKESAGVPTSLYNGMIAPLKSFPIKGVIWYQGESNTGEAMEYRTLFPAMVRGWRKQWGDDQLPFLFVQLPGFGRRQTELAPSNWAMLREAQAMTLQLPRTGMAVTVDLVPARALLHPKNKADIGHRLALLARSIAYGEAVDAWSPMFASMQIESGAARIRFTHADGELVVRAAPEERAEPSTTAPSEVTGFAIAGADHKFVRATARIDADTVIVSSDEVNSPVAVRYAWEENPQVDLYNAAGLPVAPFRTDDWPQ
ncbi:MAG TPA: sialate O-acetylesterase [Tepidisphaeraceae bacterium]|nr:sialate O-acetylesterase [Tepidisphaeraceae bacterium]